MTEVVRMKSVLIVIGLAVILIALIAVYVVVPDSE